MKAYYVLSNVLNSLLTVTLPMPVSDITEFSKSFKSPFLPPSPLTYPLSLASFLLSFLPTSFLPFNQWNSLKQKLLLTELHHSAKTKLEKTEWAKWKSDWNKDLDTAVSHERNLVDFSTTTRVHYWSAMPFFPSFSVPSKIIIAFHGALQKPVASPSFTHSFSYFASLNPVECFQTKASEKQRPTLWLSGIHGQNCFWRPSACHLFADWVSAPNNIFFIGLG